MCTYVFLPREADRTTDFRLLRPRFAQKGRGSQDSIIILMILLAIMILRLTIIGNNDKGRPRSAQKGAGATPPVVFWLPGSLAAKLGGWPPVASKQAPKVTPSAQRLPDGVRTNIIVCYTSAIIPVHFDILSFIQLDSLVVQHMMHAKHKSSWAST